MRKLKLTRKRQEHFLKALSETDQAKPSLRTAERWTSPSPPPGEQAEDMAADRLADEARRRAVDLVQEPLVSAGKLVRDDEVASGCC